MAKRHENRAFSIGVVGLSGQEKDRAVAGIGKSCLCNRFLRPLADDYFTDHISVLSQNDFSGPVVNNDHYLYWGEVVKTTHEGIDYNFHVVEQTEFIDDSSFQAFENRKMEPYYKRCAALKLQSAEKKMYICKNQLGLEHEYEEKNMPDGKLSIDGFLCLFDVSQVPQRSIELQMEHTHFILTSLTKTKKPIVLVTTKNDSCVESYVREAEKLVNRKDLKVNIPIVETSAHENVNVELAFITLAHLMDRTKNRPKIIPYAEAARSRKELLDVAKDAYHHLLRSHMVDHNVHWMTVHRKVQSNPDYLHFVDLLGTDRARELFQQHKKSLREEFVRQKQNYFLDRLRAVLKEILADLTTVADRSWPSILRWLLRQDYYTKYFIQLPEDDCPWYLGNYVERSAAPGEDLAIPHDLLDSPDAELVFREHVDTLRAEYRRTELKEQFRQLLEVNYNVCPGKSLSEVAIFFVGRECFTALSEDDKNAIYEQHQRHLRETVRKEFLELLLEHATLFSRFNQQEVTSSDVTRITEKLQAEQRYCAMNRVESDRKAILLNHLSFVQHPSQEKCPFRDRCMDSVIDTVLATKAHRPQSWNRDGQFLLDTEDNNLNLVILGSSDLADHMARDIRVQCEEDELTLDGQLYNLDYRLLDGDVSLPHNSFKTADFLPHGCFCVFNCANSLEYVRSSLEKTLMSDLQREDRLPFQGLPIVLVLAHSPDITEQGLQWLRDEGQSLANRLQCPFIDIPSSMMVDPLARFHEQQIGLALHKMVQCIRHRSSLFKPLQIAESIEPDIRILMCFMCGDDFSVDLPLAPLLNHQCCFVNSDRSEKYPTVTLETYLDNSKRKVEVTVLSYHSATRVQDALFHGYILIYSARRKASLASLGAFVMSIPPVPIKILAITESGGANAFFSNEQTQNLITDGNALADQHCASFMTTCANFQQQSKLQAASYTPFFKECWDKKSDTESAFTFRDDDETFQLSDELYRKRHDHLALRPPALLPKPPKRGDSYGVGKSSSNSTEDSDPIYDHPHFPACHSDSEGDSQHSASSQPPGVDLSPYGTLDDDIYSEIAPQGNDDTEQLIKPTQLKRTLYAEHYRKSYPSMSSSVASSSYREDSTDTDSSVRSPKLIHVEIPQVPSVMISSTTGAPSAEAIANESEPHYQFRKSNSMKLALKQADEGSSCTKAVLRDVRRRLTKSTTLPSSAVLPSDKPPISPHLLARRSAGTYDGVRYERFGDGKGRKKPPPTLPKPKLLLNDPKFDGVRNMLNRNHKRNNAAEHSSVKAPLALPEHIEISDYAQVKDALSPGDENLYASVANALPQGQLHRIRTVSRKQNDNAGTDSDSEFSSLERDNRPEDIYSRVNRRPTPHKKKHKQRHLDSSLPPPIPAYTEERHILVQGDQLDRVRGSNSPSEGSEGDETNRRHQKKRRSQKSKKKRDPEPHIIISQPWSDSDLTNSIHGKSLPYEDGSYEGGERIFQREFSSSKYSDQEDYTEGSWKFWQKSDGDRRQKKEDKRAKEDEKKKMKEEEKRQKEQQKMMKRSRRKDGRNTNAGASTSGATLEEQAQSDGNSVPLLVQKWSTYIEEEGMETEGIYRVPGNRAHVDLLFEKFKEDNEVDIAELDIQVNAVATALKQFFSDLPDPLVPSSLYDELIKSAGQEKLERLPNIRAVLWRMPNANQEVLRFIITHIHTVAKHSGQHAMDSRNLAICWSPTLLRPPITSLGEMTLVLKHLEEIVHMLIEHHRFFFHGEPALI